MSLLISRLLSTTLLILRVNLILSTCPSSDLLKPCVCENDRINCGGNHSIDLLSIFDKLDKSLLKNETHFDVFYLNNSAITELKENTFKDITFDEIQIENCNNLMTIDENAFNGTDQVTKRVFILYNPRLNSPIFSKLSKFINAYRFVVSYSNITEIPDYALRPQNGKHLDKLYSIALIGSSFKKLGQKAFYSIPNLSMINFGETSIQSIPDFAFEFENTSDTTLVISFMTNPFINSSSFSAKSLVKLNRPVHFDFGWKDNRFDYLDEKIFLPFLKSNKSNQVGLYQQQFNCNDCRNYWIVKNLDVLTQFKDLYCSNGKNIKDAVNFNNCTSFE